MTTPPNEPGWEIIMGREAEVKWGPKDADAMEVWINNGGWRKPDRHHYATSCWYRRRTVTAEEAHF